MRKGIIALSITLIVLIISLGIVFYVSFEKYSLKEEFRETFHQKMDEGCNQERMSPEDLEICKEATKCIVDSFVELVDEEDVEEANKKLNEEDVEEFMAYYLYPKLYNPETRENQLVEIYENCYGPLIEG